MKTNAYRIIYGTCFIFISLILQAKTIEIEATSKIKKVMVFPEHANIERVFKHSFQPGFYTLKLSHLPFRLMDSSIRVSGKGTAQAIILNVKVKKEFLAKAFKKNIQDLEFKREQFLEQLTSISDKINALSQRSEMLKRLTNKTTDALANRKNITPPPLQNWEGMLNFLEHQLVDIFSKQRNLEKKKKELEEQLRLLEKNLDQNRQARKKEEKTVLVDMEIIKSGDLTVTTSYIIGSVEWKPSYDLRIDSKDKKAKLTCSAMVSQQTAEDWKDVQLTFSTAKPLVIKRIPKLSPIIMDRVKRYTGEIQGTVIDIDGVQLPGITVTLKDFVANRDRTTVTDANGKFWFRHLIPGTYDLVYSLEGFNTTYQKGLRVYDYKISKPTVTMTISTIQEQIVVSGKAPTLDAQSVTKKTTHKINGIDTYADVSRSKPKQKKVKAGLVKIEEIPKPIEFEVKQATAGLAQHNVSLSFSLKHKESVLSNSSAQKATIFIKNVWLDLEHVAVPRRSEHTFLKAIVKNNTGNPFLAGPINVFYNGTFVNTSHIDFVNPESTFELAVGVDDSIQVIREPLPEASRIKGVFKKKEKKHLGYYIKIKNFHKTPIKIKIFDQLPISKNKDIQIINTLIKPEPKIQKKEDKVKQDGILEWEIELNSNTTKSIKVEYDVVYPKGMIVEEQS